MPATVLIIEDDKELLELYAQLFKDEGYNVLSYSHGGKAMKDVLGLTWNLLVLDIMLPGNDGLEILEKVKKDSSKKNLPVIVLTQLGNDHVIKQCFDMGVNNYLIKTEVTPGAVVSEVKSLLNERK